MPLESMVVRRDTPIQARQFDGTAIGARELVAWANEGPHDFLGSHRAITHETGGRTGLMIHMPTHGGFMAWVPVFEGWWVLRLQDSWLDRLLGLQAVLITCSPEQFEGTFVEVVPLT